MLAKSLTATSKLFTLLAVACCVVGVLSSEVRADPDPHNNLEDPPVFSIQCLADCNSSIETIPCDTCVCQEGTSDQCPTACKCTTPLQGQCLCKPR